MASFIQYTQDLVAGSFLFLAVLHHSCDFIYGGAASVVDQKPQPYTARAISAAFFVLYLLLEKV